MTPPLPFRDRQEAGQLLGDVVGMMDLPAGIVLGLPRGGVPVAAGVARALDWPLDVLVVRKLGAPGWRELAIGALGPGGACWLNRDLIARLSVTPADLQAVESEEHAELERREQVYRAGRPPLGLTSRAAVLVNDGTATGATMRVAARSARALGALTVIVALPVAPPEVIPELQREADRVICLATPEGFQAVGQFYRDFRQVGDGEVMALLR